MRPHKTARYTIIGALVLIIGVPVLVICALFTPAGSHESQESQVASCYQVSVANGTTTHGAAMALESKSQLPHSVVVKALEDFQSSSGISAVNDLVACPASDGQNIEIHVATLRGS